MRIFYTLLFLAFTIISSLLAGISIGNFARRQYLEDSVNYELSMCERDETMVYCHAEYIYEGIVLVDIEVLGEGVK